MTDKNILRTLQAIYRKTHTDLCTKQDKNRKCHPYNNLLNKKDKQLLYSSKQHQRHINCTVYPFRKVTSETYPLENDVRKKINNDLW